jgi:hypothetical protein
LTRFFFKFLNEICKRGTGFDFSEEQNGTQNCEQNKEKESMYVKKKKKQKKKKKEIGRRKKEESRSKEGVSVVLWINPSIHPYKQKKNLGFNLFCSNP